MGENRGGRSVYQGEGWQMSKTIDQTRAAGIQSDLSTFMSRCVAGNHSLLLLPIL